MNQELMEKENAGADAKSNARDSKMEQRPGSSRRFLLILLPIVLLGAGYWAYQNYFSNRETTDDAQIDGHINPIAAKAMGHVTAINITDNQFVQAGTVLIQIDPADYQVALERAQADVAAAKSVLISAQTQVPMTSTTTASQTNLAGAGVEQAEQAKAVAMKDVETAKARLESVQARVRETEANYTKAMQDLQRMKQLIEKDEISKQQYDAAVAQADATRASCDSAKAGVEEANKTISTAQTRVAQAEARIKEAKASLQATQTAPQQIAISRSAVQTAQARVKLAEAALQQAELNLQYTQVKAPIDGIVSQRKVELGQYVQIGQSLLALVPLHNVWVTANYKENQLKDMHPGQRAVIAVDAYGGRKYEGRVDSIAAATGARFSLLPPENATGNYVKVVQRVPVKILIERGEDETHLLRPGLSVIASVFTGEEEQKQSTKK